MDVRCSLKPFVASTMTLQPYTGSDPPPKTPRSTPDLHRRITVVRVAPYAHIQHIKVTKHFVYIQYGCGMQTEACCCLNNDITTSHGLRSTPNTPTSTPNLHRRITQ